MTETVVPSSAEDLDLDMMRSQIDAVLDVFLNAQIREAVLPQQGVAATAHGVSPAMMRLRP
ncbi:hypothetical protein ACWC2T_45505 [Streptomyces sp. NPDC001393]